MRAWRRRSGTQRWEAHDSFPFFFNFFLRLLQLLVLLAAAPLGAMHCIGSGTPWRCAFHRQRHHLALSVALYLQRNQQRTPNEMQAHATPCMH